MSGQTTVVKTISRVETLICSAAGNPRFRVHCTDGTAYTTQSDAAVNYGIRNSELQDAPVEFTLSPYGRIVYANPRPAHHLKEESVEDEDKPVESPDDTVAVFIASAKHAPTRLRVLWHVSRADAKKICSDERTRGSNWGLHWTAYNVGDPDCHQFVKDDGRFAGVLAEHGVTIREQL